MACALPAQKQNIAATQIVENLVVMAFEAPGERIDPQARAVRLGKFSDGAAAFFTTATLLYTW